MLWPFRFPGQMGDNTEMGQFYLLSSRRYLPYFLTQFFGAFNDNFFKNALVILVTYENMTILSLEPQMVVALSAGIFIAPYFLFSATAGQLADKYEKSRLIFWIKVAEVAIMVVAALGFWFQSPPLLLLVLMLLGLQSTFFGPVKFGILPQLVGKDELVGANALVEMGTFLAILSGTIAGGLLIAVPHGGLWVAGGGVIVALVGCLASSFIIKAPGGEADLRIEWNPIPPTIRMFRFAAENRAIFNSILALSWFWLVGAIFLSVFPAFGKQTLHGNPEVVTFLLGLFSIGICVGSLLCERLSDKRLELGLVPLGSIGLTVFAIDLYFSSTYVIAAPANLVGFWEFLETPGSTRVMIDLFLFSVSGGFYVVPLYTLIQERSPEAVRSRIIAANNILNSLFIVMSSLILVALFANKLSIPEIFLVVALLNTAVAFYIYQTIPEFLLRFVVWMVANIAYRLNVVNRHKIPEKGPAVLVCNHVGFVDWMILASAVRQPLRFVMWYGFLKMPLVGWLFRDAKVIPIAPAKIDQGILEEAYDTIAKELENGEIVCIFPEGGLTRDGEMLEFKPGIEKIIQRTPVPVTPMALQGVWGSFFSRAPNKGFFKRFWSRVNLVVGDPIPPEKVSAASLRREVSELRGDHL